MVVDIQKILGTSDWTPVARKKKNFRNGSGTVWCPRLTIFDDLFANGLNSQRSETWYHFFQFLRSNCEKKDLDSFIFLYNFWPICRFKIRRTCVSIKSFSVTNEQIWFMNVFMRVKPRNKEYLWLMIWISCC